MTRRLETPCLRLPAATWRGFTLVELLVSMTVLLLVSASAFALVTPIRAAFDRQPGAIDMRQRGRAGLDALGRAVLGAGGDLGVGASAWRLPSMMPVLWPLSSLDGLEAGGLPHALLTIAVVAGGGQGRVADDQAGPAGVLRLAADEGCPSVSVLCGFTIGSVVAIVDERGRFDIFEIGAMTVAVRGITPAAPLARAYRAGAWLVEVEANRLGLRAESDGSRTLVRRAWSGAVEPIVDGVVSLDLRVLGQAAPPALEEPAGEDAGGASYGPPPVPPDATDPDGVWPDGEHCAIARDAAGPRSRLEAWGPPETLVAVRTDDLLDGPWCPGPSAPDAYDADLFRIRQVEMVLRLEATSARLRGPAGSLFARGGHADASRWLPDREIVLTVTRR